MNLIFFQNCISPHQMPYIEFLSSFNGVENVWVIVPEIDMTSRKEMGWHASNFMKRGKIKFMINPPDDEVSELFHQYNGSNTWCLFSGITSFPMVSKFFKVSLHYQLKRAVITEPPLIYNHPLWQHAIRFTLKDWRYVKYIDKFFVMGSDFVSYYRLWSKRWSVVPFMYCTQWKERSLPFSETMHSTKLKVLFVGALSHRKNVELLLRSAQSMSVEEQKDLEIGIVGEGEKSSALHELTHSDKNQTQVIFYGVQPMDKVSSIMEQYDVLCLPSLHDGWGAVVNEALTLGLYVICSDSCGAKYLIERSGNMCGQSFKSNDANGLKMVLEDCLAGREHIRQNMMNRIDWARNNIHGEIVAHSFLENLKK